MNAKPGRAVPTLIAMLIGPAPVSAQDTDSFSWSVIPYLWTTRTKVNLSYRGEPIGGDEISFNDLLDVLDSAFLIHAEGGHGHWSTYLDLTSLKTFGREKRPLWMQPSGRV